MAIGPTIIGPTNGLRLEVHAPDQAVYSVYGEKLWMFTAGIVTAPDQAIPEPLISFSIRDDKLQEDYGRLEITLSRNGCWAVMHAWNPQLFRLITAYRQRVRDAEEAAKKPAVVDTSAVRAMPTKPPSPRKPGRKWGGSNSEAARDSRRSRG